MNHWRPEARGSDVAVSSIGAPDDDADYEKGAASDHGPQPQLHFTSPGGLHGMSPHWVPDRPRVEQGGTRFRGEKAGPVDWKLPLGARLGQMCAGLSYPSVGRGLRSAFEEQLKMSEEELGVLILRGVPRIRIYDQLRVGDMLLQVERIHRRQHHVQASIND